jgi:predicted nucleotide-binding protein
MPSVSTQFEPWERRWQQGVDAPRLWVAEHADLLQTIWAKFDSDGEWPNVKGLQRELFGTPLEFDADELGRSFPPPLGRVDVSAGKIILGPRGLAVVPAAEPLLRALVALVDVALDRYEDTSRDPEISGREFEGLLGIDARRARQLEEILTLDAWLLRPAGGAIGEDIRLAIDDSAVRYVREVTSIDDYLEAQDRMWHPPRPLDQNPDLSMTETESREDSAAPRDAPSAIHPQAAIFLVHGHALERLHEVARFIEKVSDHEVVILHEKADRGRTLIEKFEHNAQSAAHAVVLLTADDVGRPASAEDSESRPRGRQNVVLELGFFLGKLGRNHVTVLEDPGIEEPSDIRGIVYIPLDRNGAWKAKLGRKLAASGIVVDMNKAP